MSDGLLTDGELSGGAICGWIKITTGGAAPGESQVQKRGFLCFLSFFTGYSPPISQEMRQ